jgi:arylsulfatase A-like enzyme
MVRFGKWKAVRRNLFKNPDAAIELYDLAADVGETTDLSGAHSDLVGKARAIMRAEHRPSKEFPFPALDR